jgi:hypothetical protein
MTARYHGCESPGTDRRLASGRGARSQRFGSAPHAGAWRAPGGFGYEPSVGAGAGKSLPHGLPFALTKFGALFDIDVGTTRWQEGGALLLDARTSRRPVSGATSLAVLRSVNASLGFPLPFARVMRAMMVGDIP